MIDANFPRKPADVIADIKKTTKKPIKYVLDTHHHGDHAYGNTIWAKEGAQIVAHRNAARLLKTNGPKQWEEAAKDRKDIKDNELKQVDIAFDDKYELKDDTQHVVFMHFGHSHTSGDAGVPAQTQDPLHRRRVRQRRSFNYMGHSNSASWIKCLDAMDKLDIDIVCPGHGKLSRKELIQKEKRYFTDLRAAVKKGIDDKKSAEDITKGLDFPWYKEWTGVNVAETDMNKDNVKHVYNELMGKVDHDRIGTRPAPLDLGAGAEYCFGGTIIQCVRGTQNSSRGEISATFFTAANEKLTTGIAASIVFQPTVGLMPFFPPSATRPLRRVAPAARSCPMPSTCAKPALFLPLPVMSLALNRLRRRRNRFTALETSKRIARLPSRCSARD